MTRINYKRAQKELVRRYGEIILNGDINVSNSYGLVVKFTNGATRRFKGDCWDVVSKFIDDQVYVMIANPRIDNYCLYPWRALKEIVGSRIIEDKDGNCIAVPIVLEYNND